MAKDNCAAGLRSFHPLNSRGQLNSETEISAPILNPQEGILTGPLGLGATTNPSNQQWLGARATHCKNGTDAHPKSQ